MLRRLAFRFRGFGVFPAEAAGDVERTVARRAFDAGWLAGFNAIDVRLAPCAPAEAVDAWHEGYALGRSTILAW